MAVIPLYDAPVTNALTISAKVAMNMVIHNVFLIDSNDELEASVSEDLLINIQSKPPLAVILASDESMKVQETWISNAGYADLLRRAVASYVISQTCSQIDTGKDSERIDAITLLDLPVLAGLMVDTLPMTYEKCPRDRLERLLDTEDAANYKDALLITFEFLLHHLPAVPLKLAKGK